jgi:hypothetical protein
MQTSNTIEVMVHFANSVPLFLSLFEVSGIARPKQFLPAPLVAVTYDFEALLGAGRKFGK